MSTQGGVTMTLKHKGPKFRSDVEALKQVIQEQKITIQDQAKLVQALEAEMKIRDESDGQYAALAAEMQKERMAVVDLARLLTNSKVADRDNRIEQLYAGIRALQEENRTLKALLSQKNMAMPSPKTPIAVPGTKRSRWRFWEKAPELQPLPVEPPKRRGGPRPGAGRKTKDPLMQALIPPQTEGAGEAPVPERKIDESKGPDAGGETADTQKS